MADKRNKPEAEEPRFTGKRELYRNLIVMLVIVVAATVFLNLDKSGGKIIWGESGLSLEEKNGNSVTVSYDDIISAEVTELDDYGEPVNGESTKNYKTGMWNNDRWGDYYLMVTCSTKKVIVLTAKDGAAYVINYETEDVTVDIYNSMLEIFAEGGYDIDAVPFDK
ncbi:MAG: PH domain-containing protein [Oscillospiraceae bacterium]